MPNEITLIGRSQVHVFERARRLDGAVLRFGELLHGDAIAIARHQRRSPFEVVLSHR